MVFFEKIKDFIFMYKVNIIITIILIIMILGGNFTVYYLLSNNNDNSEITYELSKEYEIIEDTYEVTNSEEILYKVDIKGAVNKPGVYELQDKSRVIDVINLAGGLLETADTSVNNLSKYITDEMVIIIYTKEEVNRFKEVLKEEENNEKQCIIYNEIITNDSCKDNIITDSTNKEEITIPETDIKVSINTANVELLVTVPGIGESKAKSIIEYREKNGLFTTIEEVMNVSGIGETLFEKIKEYITV